MGIPKNGDLVKVGVQIVDGELHYLHNEGNKEKKSFEIFDYTVDNNCQLQNKRVLWSVTGIRLFSLPNFNSIISNDGSKSLIYSAPNNFFLLLDSKLNPVWNATYEEEVKDNLDNIIVTIDGNIAIRDSRSMKLYGKVEMDLILINTATDEVLTTQMTHPKISMVSTMYLLSNDKNEVVLTAFSACD